MKNNDQSSWSLTTLIYLSVLQPALVQKPTQNGLRRMGDMIDDHFQFLYSVQLL